MDVRVFAQPFEVSCLGFVGDISGDLQKMVTKLVCLYCFGSSHLCRMTTWFGTVTTVTVTTVTVRDVKVLLGVVFIPLCIIAHGDS